MVFFTLRILSTATNWSPLSALEPWLRLRRRTPKRRSLSARLFVESPPDPGGGHACPRSHDCPVKITKRKGNVVVWKWDRPRIEARSLMFNNDKETKALYPKGQEGKFHSHCQKNSWPRTHTSMWVR